MKRIARIGRHLVIDLRPLRKSRDLRFLFAGQLVSMIGGQFTMVAVPYQVYALTRSSLDVGLVFATSRTASSSRSRSPSGFNALDIGLILATGRRSHGESSLSFYALDGELVFATGAVRQPHGAELWVSMPSISGESLWQQYLD